MTNPDPKALIATARARIARIVFGYDIHLIGQFADALEHSLQRIAELERELEIAKSWANHD